MTDLQVYSPEYESLFLQVQRRVADGIGPKNEEILCIVKWKLGRLRNEYFQTVRDHGDAIRSALICACQAGGNKCAAIRALIGVPWIGLGVASALLTACSPAYTVCDWRALDELRRAGYRLPNQPPTNKPDQVVAWYLQKFLPAVGRFRRKAKLDGLREADRVLWGRSVKRQIRNGLAE